MDRGMLIAASRIRQVRTPVVVNSFVSAMLPSPSAYRVTRAQTIELAVVKGAPFFADYSAEKDNTS